MTEKWEAPITGVTKAYKTGREKGVRYMKCNCPNAIIEGVEKDTWAPGLDTAIASYLDDCHARKLEARG